MGTTELYLLYIYMSTYMEWVNRMIQDLCNYYWHMKKVQRKLQKFSFCGK